MGVREDFPDEEGTCGMTRNSPGGELGQLFQVVQCSVVFSVS